MSQPLNFFLDWKLQQGHFTPLGFTGPCYDTLECNSASEMSGGH